MTSGSPGAHHLSRNGTGLSYLLDRMPNEFMLGRNRLFS